MVVIRGANNIKKLLFPVNPSGISLSESSKSHYFRVLGGYGFRVPKRDRNKFQTQTPVLTPTQPQPSTLALTPASPASNLNKTLIS